MGPVWGVFFIFLVVSRCILEGASEAVQISCRRLIVETIDW